MMEIYRTHIDTIRNYNLDPNEVIKGLNGYYESDKRNRYIIVKRNYFEGPAYFPAALYLSALIEWLREDHDIFYRPGLIFDQIEAARSAAKMCGLRAHIKDEISKRGLWCGADEDVPELVDTLFKAYDECKELRDINRKDAVKLSEENRELKESVCKDIMNYIRYEASRNGFELPEEIDGEPLTIKRVFHDLLELMRKRGAEIRNAEQETRKAVNEQLKKDTDYVADTLCDILEALGISKSNTAHLDIPGLKTKALQRASVIKSEHGRYQEQLGKAAADYQALSEENQKLKSSVFDIESTLKGVLIDTALEKKIIDSAAEEELRNSIFHDVVRVICQECYDRGLQKSDTNKLIRDCCTKHGIIAPSRYLSDEACVEYLFSLIEQKDRSFAILQDLYRDIFKKQPDGLSAKDIANKILDRVLTTEDLLHKSVDSVNKECKATGRLMVEDYKLKLKDYILKDIEEHGYRYDGLQTKSIEEIVDWIITMATSDHSFIVLKDIYTTVVSPAERLRYKDCDRPTVDHMKDYILRRFEGLHANIEYCLKKMSELDGHKKNFEILKEKQEFLSKQNMELSCKLCAKDDEISRLKDLINAMNEEVKDM